MAALEYFLVAESVSVDQTTNRVSVFNVLEEIGAPQFPVLLPGCVAIALWNSVPDDAGKDFQVKLRITLPDDQSYEMTSNFVMKTDRHRSVQRIQGLPITATGVLRFDVLLNGEHQASHAVNVKVAPYATLPKIPEVADDSSD